MTCALIILIPLSTFSFGGRGGSGAGFDARADAFSNTSSNLAANRSRHLSPFREREVLVIVAHIAADRAIRGKVGGGKKACRVISNRDQVLTV
jgi:hypothetical protein